MSKRHFRHNHQRIHVKNIVQRLPLHHQLNASKTALIEFSSVWQDWCNDHLASDFVQSNNLSNFKNGVLVIKCDKQIVASQLKHQKISLLEHFHQHRH